MIASNFEMSFSDKRIPFLDTMTMILPNNTISTSLYKKPIDICSLSHALSFHPLNCKRGIIYSQALRYRRIISDYEDHRSHLNNLLESLVARGCDPYLVSSIFQTVLSM